MALTSLICALTESIDILYVSGFGSTNTGSKSAYNTDKNVAINVFAGTKTLSPFLSFPS